MRIIGISGLEGTVPFKKAHWPHLNDREYRISQGHDSAAVLVVDGTVVAAAAEERFTRKKHTGDFPVHAIRSCLSMGGLRLEDVDEIAHGFDYSAYRKLYTLDPVSTNLYDEVLSKDALLSLVQRDLPSFPSDRVHQVSHHLAHAASAYFTSGWDECLVVVIDGMGEAHSVTVYHAHDGALDKVHQIAASDSIGILYSLVTLHLGFDFNSDEYKIMGLAPYGRPDRFSKFFDEAVELHEGSIRIPVLKLNRTRDERENYLRSREHLATASDQGTSSRRRDHRGTSGRRRRLAGVPRPDHDASLRAFREEARIATPRPGRRSGAQLHRQWQASAFRAL